MNVQQVLDSLRLFAPEVVLTGVILLVIVADLLLKRAKALVGLIALVGSLVTLVLIIAAWQRFPTEAATLVGEKVFGGAVVYDRFSLFFKGLFLSATILIIFFAAPVIAKWQTGRGEIYALMLSCTLGMCFMACANDLLMMYLSLEFVSITSYILAGFLRKNRKSIEASLKYILYGAAASGLMIYGMSFLYGITGSLHVTEIGAKLAASNVPHTMTLVISTLIMAGFGYKIAAAPFHMWCPDVYEGAPTPVTAFFSVGPKAAGFAMLIRFLQEVYQQEGDPSRQFEWKVIIALMAVITLIVGNFGALQQTNLKRLLAYSSIGHAGIMLLAFAAFNPGSWSAIIFYLTVYMIMNLGAFLVVIVLEEQFGIETVEQCRGLGWRAPALCALMVIFLLSLTGLPPTAGFVGKLLVFGNLVEVGWPRWAPDRVIPPMEIQLAIVGVLFSVVSLFYYARIIAAMFLSKPAEQGPWLKTNRLADLLAWLLAGATLLLGIFPQLVKTLADAAILGR